jgi:hypothetical protein
VKLQAHTLRYGHADWMDACVPTLEAWCQRNGYELTVWDDSIGKEKGYPNAKFVEKDVLEAFITSDATHCLWVDADIYITDHAPDFPEFEGMMMATDEPHSMHQQDWEKWCQETFGETPEGFAYCNAGCWAIDRKAAKVMLKAVSRLKMVEACMDQYWWDLCAYVATTEGMKFSRMDSAWNRWGRDFEPSHAFHLWGSDKLRDLEALRHLGLLDRKPDGLRYHFPAKGFPAQDKVLVLQFVRDSGLGNRAFELAAGLSIARRLNLPMILNWKPTEKRAFGLEHFGIGILPFTEHPVVSAKLGQGNWSIWEKAANAVHASQHRFPAICHPFQAEECFTSWPGVADEIRELFKLDPLPLDVPAGKTPVAVQVRRGDYVGHPRLNVCTEGYYLNSMEWMRTKIPSSHFFIVSDDPEWCRKTFGKLPDVTVMPPQEAIDGLRTMVACEAHCISNSTFGWWGAWLGEKGPVVVPEIWHHKPGSYGDWKPAPDRWVRVPVTRHREGGIPAANLTGLRSQRIQYDRAIVYPWHHLKDKWGKALYYSLRSLEQHFEDKDCPIYILGTGEPYRLLKNSRIKFLECWGYEAALMQGLAIAEKSLWMNDDILFLKDTSWADVEKPLHFGPVTPELRQNMIQNSNPWKQGYLRMLDLLAAEGVTEPFHYSTHTPYVFRRAEVMEVFEKFGVWSKMPLELAIFNMYPNKDSEPCGDQRTQKLPFGNARYLNHTDHLLTEDLKSAIESKFKNPASWEVKADF